MTSNTLVWLNKVAEVALELKYEYSIINNFTDVVFKDKEGTNATCYVEMIADMVSKHDNDIKFACSLISTRILKQKYYTAHKYCPKCGHDKCSSTYVDYIQ